MTNRNSTVHVVGHTGDTGNQGNRGEKGDTGTRGDRGARGKTSYLAQLLPYLAVFILLVFSYNVSEDSRDQVCGVFESSHLADVQALERTYDYLITVPEVKYSTPLNVAIVRGLKTQETKAHTDQAPEFCDTDSLFHGEFGLEEPDPEIPARPENLENLEEITQATTQGRSAER